MLMRQRDFPRELLIGDSIWRVRFVRDVKRSGDFTANYDVVGLACPERQTIYIKTGLPPVDRLAVFLHELIHALEDEHGFEMNHDLLNKLDAALARALADNFAGAPATAKRVPRQR